MKQRFQSRAAFLDERIETFLTTVTELGGYCTSEQAKGLELANSETRARMQLKGLERLGFLRRVADYPVVYQITASTTRLLGMDRRARRAHNGETVLNRLLAVSFYLDARRWPVKFAFEHGRKIDMFLLEGCSLSAIPHRGGKPYLREHFVFWYEEKDNLGVAIIDHQQQSPFWQLRGVAKSFRRLVGCMGERLELVVATGNNTRHRLYSRSLDDPRIMRLSPAEGSIKIKLYQVRRATESLELLPRSNATNLTPQNQKNSAVDTHKLIGESE
jgi:hypothetical protein